MGSYLRNCISPYSNEEVFLKKTWKVLKIAMKDFDCHILVYVSDMDMNYFYQWEYTHQ